MVPATIIRSACRGEKLIRSEPNLAKSYLEQKAAIISMAQQAVPKGMGHSEFFRAQFTALSRVEIRKVSVSSFSIPN
jgi:hypothetical protein